MKKNNKQINTDRESFFDLLYKAISPNARAEAGKSIVRSYENYIEKRTHQNTSVNASREQNDKSHQ